MSNRFALEFVEEKDEDKEDEEEGDKQLEAYKIQQRCHSAGKQANEIILEQQRGFERVEEGVPEMEHLLSGQRELQQKQRQQQLLSQQSARVNTDVASVASTVDEDVLQREEHSQRSSGTMKQQQHNNNSNSNSNSNSINDDSNRNNNRKSNINSSNNNNNNTASHAQLDIQKFPPEMQYEDQRRPATERQQQQQQQQPEYRTTIITTAPSLNATTTSKPAALGGGGGGGAIAVDAVSRASSEFKGPKIWRHLVQFWPIISQPLAIFCVFLMLWTLGFVLLPDYAVPSAAIMRIAFLFVGAQVSGILVTFLRLPDMLGMLFFGVLYTNVGLADFTGYQPLEAFLREMALINIMLLAGLGLDWKACKKLWFMILRLALVPTLAEVATVAVLARFLLNMPWLWGILLGLVITAVSPNVVVTVMLKLKEDRLGLNSGIHTLIYAMTTCNDVVAIFVFGVILGVIFSTGTLTDQILQGPIGIGIGVVFGYVYGSMLHFIPSKKALYVDGLRFVLTVLGGTVSVMGSKAIGYPSAGALGCVTVAFIAGIGWKREQQKHLKQQQEQQQQQQQQQQQHPHQQRAADDNTSVAKRLDLLWKFLKPVSFALIGKEINFTVLDGTVVGYGLLLVLLGSLVRLLFAYVSTLGGSLSRKERAYITISGFPKATVQAALGPVALDLARSLNADAEIISLANNVLIISVVAIICTAPIGAILMLRLAPLWLKHSQPCTSTEEQDDPRNASLDLRNDGHVMDSFNYQSSNKSQHFNHDPVGVVAMEAGVATRLNHHVA